MLFFAFTHTLPGICLVMLKCDLRVKIYLTEVYLLGFRKSSF